MSGCTPDGTVTATATGTIPRIGDAAPDFTAATTQGEVTLSKWSEGKWVMFFSHPADFTPVCSTEISEFARRQADFDKRNTALLCVSVDSIHSHLAWRENLQRLFNVKIAFPLVADNNAAVAAKYGMIHPGQSATATVRAVFMIDPKRVIRAIIYYPLNVGRNVDEILRLLDALQCADKNSVACPVNWKTGEAVIVPPPKTVADVEARAAMTGAGVEKIDFYLTKKMV